MLAVKIVIGLILLLLLLILLPISAKICYNSTLEEPCTVYVRYLLLRFKVYPRKEKPKPKPKTAKEPKQKQPQKKKPKPKKKAEETVETVTQMLKALPVPLKLLLKGIAVRHLVLKVSVAREDAHQTALACGQLYALLCPVIAALQSVLNMRIDTIAVTPNFLEEERLDALFSVKLTGMPVCLMIAAGYFAFLFLKEDKPSPTPANAPSNKDENKP